MITHWLTAVLVTASVAVFGQSVQSGGTTNVFPSSTLTNIYIASSVIDLQSYDSVTTTITIGNAQATGLAKVKPQWSADNSHWFNQMILDTGTVTSGEIQYTENAKVLLLPMSTGTNSVYVELIPRVARYMRYGVSCTNVVTTGTLSIELKPLNNNH